MAGKLKLTVSHFLFPEDLPQGCFSVLTSLKKAIQKPKIEAIHFFSETHDKISLKNLYRDTFTFSTQISPVPMCEGTTAEINPGK
jgi:hypothetical protein